MLGKEIGLAQTGVGDIRRRGGHGLPARQGLQVGVRVFQVKALARAKVQAARHPQPGPVRSRLHLAPARGQDLPRPARR